MVEQDLNTSENNQNASVDAGTKIEAIKNLIFGENIAAYDTEFSKIKADLEAKKADLESLIEQTHKELNAAIDTLATDLHIRITDLENTLIESTDTLEKNKVDKDALGDLLIHLGEKIRNK